MRVNARIRKLLCMVLAGVVILAPAVWPAYAALRTGPAWYDQNAVGVAPDWHYRVPVTLAGTSTVNSTVVVSMDFSALLTQMAASGTFDPNSVRVVRPNGSLATIQQFTPGIYSGANNTVAGRGEVRFIAQDAGAAVYQVYFDITENGAKPANPQTPINGSFEFSSTGDGSPTGWNTVTVSSGFDAQVRPSESPSISTDGTTAGNGASPRTVDGTPYLGGMSYLLGARTNNEGSNAFPSATLTKTITVPSTNPGSVTFHYRIQGWDSNVNGSTAQYDFFQMQLQASGVTTVAVVGPSANNYATYPFSPNYGTNNARNTRSGYGQYNGFDMDTNGTHRGASGIFMTQARGSEDWITVTYSLAAFAGKTATLLFQFNNTTLYKSWVHIDDIEWSVVSASIGTPVGFGVVGLSPAGTFNAGSLVTLSAQLDAAPNRVMVDVIDPSGATVASLLNLFNDGTHGSSLATPWLWVNDGSDPANPGFTVPRTAFTNSGWKLRVYAPDNSASLNGAVLNGGLLIPGQAATPVDPTHYYNVSDSTFSVVGRGNLEHLKAVAMYSDPINAQVNPKAIPGATVQYTLTVRSTGGGAIDMNSVYITDPIPPNTKMFVGDVSGSGSGPVLFADGSPSSGLTYSYLGLANATDSLSFSNDGGLTYNYSPTPDGQGFDAAVTHLRIKPTGTMPAAGVSTIPYFTASFRVGVK